MNFLIPDDKNQNDVTDRNVRKMTDNEVVKVKAIQPRIVASWVDGKPYYCIEWYDYEKEEILTGYGSFELEFVRDWYEECFIVVEHDLINRLKAELFEKTEQLETAKAENERLKAEVKFSDYWEYETTEKECEGK